MRSDFSERPAFETIRPRRPLGPFVFNSAHSGRDYPERFLAMARLDPLTIRHSEDAFVDDLFARAPHLGAPLIKANFPRAYLDVNREPYELDQRMFAEALPARYNQGSPRVAAGLGTIARIVGENRPIYRSRLTLADARMRIEGIYKPYHQTLQQLLSEAMMLYGAAVLIDCHSMPRLDRTGDRAGADIVLGDRYGAACAPALTDLAETLFTAAGLRVARNRPYAGGFSTRTYGRPRFGNHALQIEISRHLYMNEHTLERHDGFEAVRGIVNRLIGALMAMDIATLLPVADAAE